jgi:hypothetical protein
VVGTVVVVPGPEDSQPALEADRMGSWLEPVWV